MTALLTFNVGVELGQLAVILIAWALVGKWFAEKSWYRSRIGLNSIGLKRAGFSPETRDKIKHAYKVLYHSKLNTRNALAALKAENDPSAEVQGIIRFFEESERGVTDHREI